jgi:hypothetical protein
MTTGIAKAIEVADACKDAMVDFEVMTMAAEIVQNANALTQDEMIELMFKYSGILSANVATRLTHILMSESEFSTMTDEIQMFDEIGRDVMGN